jgi:4-hydroxybenzoate polyprenyltransferase
LVALAVAAAGLVGPSRAAGLLGVLGFAAHLGWQLRRLDIDDAAGCLLLFRSNRDAGLILAAGLLGAALL